MGQAKLRGSYEERRRMAEARIAEAKRILEAKLEKQSRERALVRSKLGILLASVVGRRD